MAQSLGEKIRKVREFRKISLEDLSKKTGYSKEFLGGLEDGSRMTTLGTLMVIAKGNIGNADGHCQGNGAACRNLFG